MIKKESKKGFTLVELLAVIVILSVVILIAVTAVIPRMNNAKKSALVDEALMYLNAAKESYVFNGETSNVSLCTNITDLNEKYIKKDNNSYSGVVITDFNNGTFTQTINLTDGKYYIVGGSVVTKSDVSDNEPNGFSTSCSGVPSVDAIGTNINIVGSNTNSFKNIELGGNSLQNGIPSVSNPVDIEVVSGDKVVTITGKNLFSTLKNQSLVRYKVFNIPLLAGTYTISFDFISTTSEDIPSFMQISYYLSDGKTVYNPVTISNGRGERTFTLAKDAVSFIIYSNTNYQTSGGITTVIDNIQIEKGSNATSFEPYQSQTYPVSLGNIVLRKVDNHSDRIYFSNGKWYLDQNIRHLELNISDMNNSDSYPGWFNSSIDQIKADFPTMNAGLETVSSYINNMGVTTRVNTNGNNKILWLGNTGLTQTQWKAQYSNLVYKLDYSAPETTTIEITDQTLISQLNDLKNARCYSDQTNITSDNLPFVINASCYK